VAGPPVDPGGGRRRGRGGGGPVLVGDTAPVGRGTPPPAAPSPNRPPTPAVLRPSVRYAKDEVIEVCGALALAEVVLSRLGRPVEAARMAAVFDLVEGRLAG